MRRLSYILTLDASHVQGFEFKLLLHFYWGILFHQLIFPYVEMRDTKVRKRSFILIQTYFSEGFWKTEPHSSNNCKWKRATHCVLGFSAFGNQLCHKASFHLSVRRAFDDPSWPQVNSFSETYITFAAPFSKCVSSSAFLSLFGVCLTILKLNLILVQNT